jgi:hypothetical protein
MSSSSSTTISELYQEKKLFFMSLLLIETCSMPIGTVLSYTSGPTIYTLMKYSYSATSSGTGILEFGFTTKNDNYEWHLNDFSLQDINMSNAKMLTNDDFESGTLAGWQLLCSNKCDRLSSAGHITGSYCYEDACEDDYDFLPQTFTKTIGHIYELSFW